MQTVKRLISAVFSLRVVVVLTAVLLLLLKHQYIVLEWADQALFMFAQGVISPEQSSLIWPLDIREAGWLNQQLLAHNLSAPSYFYWLELVLIFVMATFLVFVVPRLNLTTGILLVLGLLVALVFTQLFQQVLKQQWYPLGISAQFLLSVFYFVYCSQLFKKPTNQLL